MSTEPHAWDCDALMLVAEVITMSYERAHEGGVSREDTGAMVALMARLRDYSLISSQEFP